MFCMLNFICKLTCNYSCQISVLESLLTCVLRVKPALQQRSSGRPTSPLSDWSPQHTTWTLCKPAQENTSAEQTSLDDAVRTLLWKFLFWPAGRALWSATQPEPGLHTPPAPSAPDGREHLYFTWRVFLRVLCSGACTCCMHVKRDGGQLTCMTGITNARVFPLPVGADTQISLGL